MHDRNVDVVDRAVVVEVPPAPVTALVAEADIPKAVVDAAIEADVRPPVAAVKSIPVMVVAPVAGSPERALVRSLNPYAGSPVVALGTPRPVAGSPEIVVARSRRLFVIGQRRRRLRGIGYRLIAGTLVVRTLVVILVGGLILGAAIRRRSRLLCGICRT